MTSLTGQQQAGIEKIANWHAMGGELPFRLFGPAGTGKTTMAASIPDALGIKNVAYGAYTGKAAHVLRRSLESKGVTLPVTTIHSAIYYPTSDQETKIKLAVARDELAELLDRGDVGDEVSELEAEIAELEQQSRRLAWEWNESGPWGDLDLIILDEVSMVGPKLAADIEAYGVPILVLGDPAQLPPVDGGGYYTLQATPGYLLTEIHRQALDSPVLELATRVRTSSGPGLGLTPGDCSPASIAAAIEHDQVICWSNKRRWALIKAIRNTLGRPDGQVVSGDRVMCLSNNRDLGVFNGQQFEVLDVAAGSLGPTLLLRDDDGHDKSIPAFADGFLGQEMQDQAKKSGAGIRGGRMLATFANAITCHKSQGSQWESVYVVDETPAMISMTIRREGAAAAVEQARQWMYTAVSRASESVTVTAARRV